MVFFVVTALVPLVFISAVMIVDIERQLTQRVLGDLRLTAEIKRGSLLDYLAERLEDVEAAASFLARTDLITLLKEQDAQAYERISGFLNDLLRVDDYFDIFVTDESGKALLAVTMRDQVEGRDMSGRDYVQRSLRGQKGFSSIFFSDVAKGYVKVVSAPIPGGDGRTVLGTVSLVMGIEEVSKIVFSSADTIGKTGDAYLVSRDGTLLTRPRFGKDEDVGKVKVATEAYRIWWL